MKNVNKIKSLIFKLVIKVFFECGYRGVIMDDIVLNVKFVKGILYYYFISKEEIFNFIVEEGF